MAPMNVTASRINDTAMNVSWIPLTLVEARGFVKYVITYMKAGGSRKRQSPSPKIVNGTDNSCVVNDLEQGVEYDVIVGAQTGGGTNGKHCEDYYNTAWYVCLTLSLSIMTAASPVIRVGLGTGRVND